MQIKSVGKYIRTPEIREKIRKKVKANGLKPWLGKKRPPFSKEWIEKLRSSSIKAGCKPPTGYGKDNPNWKGGKSFEHYPSDWTNTLRISIRERDNYICKICGEKQGDIAHHVHHIDYDKRNCDPNNLVTLCSHCHKKTNGNREYWIKYFYAIQPL